MKDYYTPEERIQFIMDAVAKGNQGDFCEKTGLLESTVSRMRSGMLKLSEERIQVICKAYPSVNAQFLRDGMSDPGDITVEIVKERMQREIEKRDKLIETLQNQLKLDQRIIARLTKK